MFSSDLGVCVCVFFFSLHFLDGTTLLCFSFLKEQWASVRGVASQCTLQSAHRALGASGTRCVSSARRAASFWTRRRCATTTARCTARRATASTLAPTALATRAAAPSCTPRVLRLLRTLPLPLPLQQHLLRRPCSVPSAARRLTRSPSSAQSAARPSEHTHELCVCFSRLRYARFPHALSPARAGKTRKKDGRKRGKKKRERTARVVERENCSQGERERGGMLLTRCSGRRPRQPPSRARAASGGGRRGQRRCGGPRPWCCRHR